MYAAVRLPWQHISSDEKIIKAPSGTYQLSNLKLQFFVRMLTAEEKNSWMVLCQNDLKMDLKNAQ